MGVVLYAPSDNIKRTKVRAYVCSVHVQAGREPLLGRNQTHPGAWRTTGRSYGGRHSVRVRHAVPIQSSRWCVSNLASVVLQLFIISITLVSLHLVVLQLFIISITLVSLHLVVLQLFIISITLVLLHLV